jgi:hypothetical protein
MAAGPRLGKVGLLERQFDKSDRGQGAEAERERVGRAAQPAGAALGGFERPGSPAGHRAAVSGCGAACLLRVVSHSS